LTESHTQEDTLRINDRESCHGTSKKRSQAPEPPKPNSNYLKLKQIEAERRRAKEIERMIEAKVAMALRLLDS